jgi:hypothetical protein
LCVAGAKCVVLERRQAFAESVQGQECCHASLTVGGVRLLDLERDACDLLQSEALRQVFHAFN